MNEQTIKRVHQTERRMQQGCILSPGLFNRNGEMILRGVDMLRVFIIISRFLLNCFSPDKRKLSPVMHKVFLILRVNLYPNLKLNLDYNAEI